MTSTSLNGTPGSPGFPVKQLAALLVVALAEIAMWTIHLAMYVDNIKILSTIFLANLPFVGGFFEFIDPNSTGAGLLCAVLALISVAVPIFLWAEILRHGILKDPKSWWREPRHRAYTAVAVVIYGLIIGLECFNLLSYIEVAAQPSPLPIQRDGLPDYLAANLWLAVMLSLVFSIFNAVSALLTVVAFRAFTNARP